MLLWEKAADLSSSDVNLLFMKPRRDSLCGQQHAAPRLQLVRVALPAQVLRRGSGWKLRLTNITEVPRQVDGLTCSTEEERDCQAFGKLFLCFFFKSEFVLLNFFSFPVS